MSNIQIIGMEGTSHGDGLAWGAAALSDGAELINPVSGARCLLRKAKELAEEGHLTLFPEPIPWKDNYILRIPVVQMLPLYTEGEKGLPWFQTWEYSYATFRTFEHFKGWAWSRANALCDEALKQVSAEDAEPLHRAARVLDYDHEKVNALWVLSAPIHARALRERIAMASLNRAGLEAIETFHRYLNEIVLPASWHSAETTPQQQDK